MTESKRLRLVYMGTPDFAVAPLRHLVENGYNVVAVITMPDKPAGRGLKMQESAVKRYAAEAGLPVLQPEKLKEPQFVEQFRALDADLGIVIAFRMLPEVIWSMPRLGTFNLHASLLPQYRGAAPINWALIDGETETGVTTFMLNHEIDKGDILGQRRVAITPEETAGSLHDKLMHAGVELVGETIDRIAKGDITPLPQGHIAVESLRPAPKIFKEDCRIDWKRDAAAIHNLIRGLSPYPAAFGELVAETARKGIGEKAADKGAVTVKIFGAAYDPANPEALPGAIVSDGKSFLRVACGEGSILVTELQAAGKKRMPVEDFLRGFAHITDYRFA